MPKKTITISILLFLLFSTLLFAKPEIALAAPKTFEPQVDIGVTDLNVDGGLMGRYIEGIYKYSIGFVGILAAVVLMFGGFLWITAAGNGERVANAKAWIQAALSGLVLALCSYTILWYVNPDLVKFESIDIKETKKSDDLSGYFDIGSTKTPDGHLCEEDCPTNDCKYILTEYNGLYDVYCRYEEEKICSWGYSCSGIEGVDYTIGNEIDCQDETKWNKDLKCCCQK